MDLSPFKNLIKEKTGLCFENNQEAKLETAVQEMASRKGLSSTARYYQLLLQSEGEFHRLIDRLTINETYFFREPAHMKVFAERLIPGLLAGMTSAARLRILSAGCSTGEEPYSLVMALMEKYGAGIRHLFSLLAVDIDSEAIGAARQGIYGKSSFRSFHPEMLGKYFASDGNGEYRIKESVKEMVQFHQFNLLSETYPASLQQMDFIFYRNVSIYFEPETQRKILGRLAEILNPGGYLITSSAETLSHDVKILSMVEMDGIFLFRKNEVPPQGASDHSFTGGTPASPGRPPSPLLSAPAGMAPLEKKGISSPGLSPLRETRSAPPPAAKAPAVARGTPDRLWGEALSLVKSKSYAPALKIVEQIMALDPRANKTYTLKAGILLQLGRLQESAQACGRVLEMDPFCLESHVLLGLIAWQNHDEEGALKKFKEALYLQSSCWPAHYYMAEVYRTRGKVEKAQREYAIVLRLIQKESWPGEGVAFLPLFTPPGQIAAECRRRLSAIERFR